MNSFILCEGPTDFSLLQYFMRETFGWIDDKDLQKGVLKMDGGISRKLKKNSGDMLTIMSVGGKSRFAEGLKQVLDYNKIARPDMNEIINKIAIITDRDNDEAENAIIQVISETISQYNTGELSLPENNQWSTFCMVNNGEWEISTDILLMVIPFTTNGAMETFLLDAISDADEYDGSIINKCSDFVDSVDPHEKYLKSNRYKVKAKFDVYFSVRTPVEQFKERQSILKSGVDWKEYIKIQQDFQKLGEM